MRYNPLPKIRSSATVMPDNFIKKQRRAEKGAVPIVFCGDEGYGVYLPVAVQSIIDNASAETCYNIIILDCGIGESVIAALQRQISGRPNFSLQVKNIDAWLAAHKNVFCERLYFTRAIYGRLAIPGILPEYDKIIYADIDMVFNRDAAELLNIDLGDNYIGAVEDALIEIDRAEGETNALSIAQMTGLTANDIYVNSGLLVFNAGLWRAQKLTEKLLRFMEGKKLTLPDQDALNAICKGRICYLPQEWNCLSEYYLARRLREAASFIPRARKIVARWQTALAAGRNILHYNGPVKPWAQARRPSALRWWHYAAETELFPQYICALAAAPAAEDRSLAVYRFFGVPILTVKKQPNKAIYSLGGRLRLAKKITNKNSADFYFCGLKLFSSKVKEI